MIGISKNEKVKEEYIRKNLLSFYEYVISGLVFCAGMAILISVVVFQIRYWNNIHLFWSIFGQIAPWYLFSLVYVPISFESLCSARRKALALLSDPSIQLQRNNLPAGLVLNSIHTLPSDADEEVARRYARDLQQIADYKLSSHSRNYPREDVEIDYTQRAMLQQMIETALQPLIGLPITNISQPDAIENEVLHRFEFGAPDRSIDKNGEQISSGGYALNVVSPWRIIGQGNIQVTYRDQYSPPGRPTISWDTVDSDLSAPKDNHADTRILRFMEKQKLAPLCVESIAVDEIGSVHIKLSRGYSLEILPMDSSPCEFWRMMNLADEKVLDWQIMVTGQGIEYRS